ncbi:MAG: beta-CASP ribonuclease aCPSF1, partial [Candidatus Methanoplasma sp.]|nr:beta-CASP ribonuclease aCPSF1 [Candidatus Methanoplasma sp.]
MNPDKLFESLRDDVRKLVPGDMNISGIEFEGSVIVIYTGEYDKFSSNDSIPRMLAQNLRRRVDIRPDPSGLEDPEKVRERMMTM